MGKATSKVVATSKHFALLDLLGTACSADLLAPSCRQDRYLSLLKYMKKISLLYKVVNTSKQTDEEKLL